MENKLRLLAKESAELTYLSLMFVDSLNNHPFYHPDLTDLKEAIDDHLVSTINLFYKIIPKMEECNENKR